MGFKKIMAINSWYFMDVIPVIVALDYCMMVFGGMSWRKGEELKNQPNNCMLES